MNKYGKSTTKFSKGNKNKNTSEPFLHFDFLEDGPPKKFPDRCGEASNSLGQKGYMRI